VSNEDKVLLAIYNECQKESPNISKEVTTAKLDMETGAFNTAIKNLSDSKLIEGANIVLSSGNIVAAFINNVSITDAGKEYVSKNLL